MGNESNTRYQPPLPQYKQIQKQQHPFLGSITHLTHRQNTKHMLKLFKYATNPQLMDWLKRANRRKQLSKKKGSIHILRTTQIVCDKKNQLCGITYYLYVVYQEFLASVGDCIRGKREAKEGFVQDEIFDLIRGVCNAIVFLNDHGFKNYAISRETVVKGIPSKQHPNTNIYKVFDTQLARQLSPYQKLLHGMPIQKSIYLAPQHLQQLLQKNPDPQISLKSDVFSLGMVALEMCLLDSLDCDYDYENLTINQQSIYQKIGRISYSPDLKTILREMLEAKEDERIGIVTLREKISGNDNKSTTDYGYSAFGNSNVTQRTHKLSYPNNTTRDGIRENTYQQQQRIPRIMTAEDIRQQQHQQQVQVQIHNNNFGNIGRNKNMTLDDGLRRQKDMENQEIGRTKSTEKIKDNQEQRKRGTIVNSPFYYPPHIKTVITTPNNPQLRPVNVIYTNAPPLPNKPVTYIAATPPIQNNQRPATGTIGTMGAIGNMGTIGTMGNMGTIGTVGVMDTTTMPVPSKLPDLQIQDHSMQIRSQPQTPINNLADSSDLVYSDMLLMGNKNSFNDENSVLNSFNCIFKKGQSKQQAPITKILQTPLQYQSPQRLQQVGNQLPTSNQSTPIRKVQALQSHSRNPSTTIKQSQQQCQPQNALNPLNPTPTTGPKTYGKHHFTSGAVYQGEFDYTGNFCGNGVLYYSNGAVCYSGGWNQNCFHGFGVLYNQVQGTGNQVTNYQDFNQNNWSGWHHYEGQFQMDKKHGFGNLFMSNGDKFSGCFVKDIIEGYGTFTPKIGNKVSGIWSQNVLRKL